MKWKGMETKYEKYVQHLYSSLKLLGCKFKFILVGQSDEHRRFRGTYFVNRR
jgi:hypothetical protein